MEEKNEKRQKQNRSHPQDGARAKERAPRPGRAKSTRDGGKARGLSAGLHGGVFGGDGKHRADAEHKRSASGRKPSGRRNPGEEQNRYSDPGHKSRRRLHEGQNHGAPGHEHREIRAEQGRAEFLTEESWEQSAVVEQPEENFTLRQEAAVPAAVTEEKPQNAEEAASAGSGTAPAPEKANSPHIGRDYQLDDVADVEEGEGRIEGRNAVTEAFRAGRTIDRLYVLDGCQDGPVLTIKRLAAKAGTPIKYLSRQRLDQLSETGRHQGVIAVAAAYHYSTMDDLFKKAEEKGEDPFFIILDDIEDPHNLGAIIRTANVVGADGVIIPKDRAVGLTATVAKASAGALNFTPVVKVTNLSQTIEELKKKGMWFVCADMDGTPMTKLNLTGPIGLVIGAEGNGVSRLVKEKCDIVASIPMKGEINSLNASVAAGVLMYEILRQRTK